MRYVLGVDGGGTKTHCALYDADTGRLDMLPGGPADCERMSPGEIQAALRNMLRLLLTRNNITMADIEFGVLGLAGLDTEERKTAVSAIFPELGLQRFHLCGDAYIALKTSAAFGICAVNGTGSCVVGMDATGAAVQIGGLGTLTGDLGGSAMLVPRAVGLVYDQLFRGAPYTELTAVLFRWLDITDKNEFLPLITGRLQQDKPKAMLDMGKLFFQTAAGGDRAALALLERSGASYAGAIAGAMTELSFAAGEPVDIVFSGSLFAQTECRHIQDTAETMLRQRFPQRELRFHTPTVPPVAGAVLWALSELGITGHRDMVIRLFTNGVWL